MRRTVASKSLVMKSVLPSNSVFIFPAAAFVNAAHSEGEEEGIARIAAAMNGERMMIFLRHSIEEALFLRLENSAAVSNFEKAF